MEARSHSTLASLPLLCSVAIKNKCSLAWVILAFPLLCGCFNLESNTPKHGGVFCNESKIKYMASTNMCASSASFRNRLQSKVATKASSGRSDDYDYNDEGSNLNTNQNLEKLRERATQRAILDRLFRPTKSNSNSNSNSRDESESSPLVPVELLGRGILHDANFYSNASATCLFLSPPPPPYSSPPTLPRSAMAVSLPAISSQSTAILKLLSFAYRNEPISKSLCLTLNPLLVNRDGGLYDNLPWDKWTIDPDGRNRDAAGNPVSKKFHPGKKDAYDRFLGKDWFGRGLDGGNLIARAVYLLQGDLGENDDDDDDNSYMDGKENEYDDNDLKDEKNGNNFGFSNENNRNQKEGKPKLWDEEATKHLAKRVMQLEVKEARMALAQTEEDLAIAKTEAAATNPDSDQLEMDRVNAAQTAVHRAKLHLEEAESSLQTLLSPPSTPSTKSIPNSIDESQRAFVTNLLEQLQNTLSPTSSSSPEPPYRGATGYNPTIDTPTEMFVKSILPYASPYHLLIEILTEQLNADVLGCVVEQTSLFQSQANSIPGGAVVLRRRGRKQVSTIDGEEVQWVDEDDDFGSDGTLPGNVFVCECDVDEAIGVSLASGSGLWVERSLYDDMQLDVVVLDEDGASGNNGGDARQTRINVMDVLPKVRAVNEESILIRVRQDGTTSIETKRKSDDNTSAPETRDTKPEPPSPAFPTDNPIRSLQQYDDMTIEEKARTLLSLDSFRGKLPRPRVLREAEKQVKSNSPSTLQLNLMDEMLLPLIDESVRRQVLIRDAERRNDYEAARDLRDKSSRRQNVRELADEARKEGDEEEARVWDEEAEFYAELRADVTQDEGSYSSFLDRDEWYERNRRAAAKKLDKKKFGTLLDGID